jgi:glycine/D-amino acid oxidase-like deaminating enzyme/nitrite reductase/ring-hydroxylating ferredoxin subunit
MDTASYWLKTAALPAFPTLQGDITVDVAVIGGGITGITTACLARRAGLSVALLERERCARIDTGHTTAHLTAVTDTRWFELRRRFGADAARLVWSAGMRAIDQIEALVAAENIPCAFQRGPGWLHAASPQESTEELEREAQVARELGISARFVAKVPFFKVPGVRFPDQALFHPLRYLTGLLRSIPGKNGHVFERTAAGEIEDGTIRTSHGKVRFKHLVIATHNPLVGDSSVFRATLFQTKLSLYTSYALGARIPAHVVPTGCYWDTAEPYSYLRIDRGAGGEDYAIYGGEDHKTGQVADTVAVYARLEEKLRRLVPNARIDTRWSGQVIETHDGLPFIGESSDRQFIATGFSGNGLTFGTLAAIMAIDAITGVENPWRKLFDPHRVKLVGGTLSYLRENKDFPVCLVRDRFRRAEAGSLREIGPGEGKVVELDGHKAAAFRDEKGRVTVCSAICTHLQCVVAWNPAEKTWDCPCHGSRFHPDGRVISGPAEKPLPRLTQEGKPVRARRSVPGPK